MNKENFWEDKFKKEAQRVQDLASYNRKLAMSKLRLVGRPKRDTVICGEDIIYLKIQMEISPDLDTFLEGV